MLTPLQGELKTSDNKLVTVYVDLDSVLLRMAELQLQMLQESFTVESEDARRLMQSAAAVDAVREHFQQFRRQQEETYRAEREAHNTPQSNE